MTDKLNKIAIFHKKEIRRTIYNNEWWFVIEDVVLALIDSNDPKQYIQKMKLRDPELKKGWVQFVHTLSIETKGGNQKLNCANAEGIFRIIQSIPSPKAEPFKRWLARVGYGSSLLVIARSVAVWLACPERMKFAEWAAIYHSRLLRKYTYLPVGRLAMTAH